MCLCFSPPLILVEPLCLQEFAFRLLVITPNLAFLVFTESSFLQLILPLPYLAYSGVLKLFGPRDQFHGRRFFHRPVGGGVWFQDHFKHITFICAPYF